MKAYQGSFNLVNPTVNLRSQQKMGNLSELSLSAIIKLTYRVAYKLTRKQEKVQEKVGEVMGGKVLDLPEFRIYDQGKAEGLAEGAKEREELKIENERLRRELEELKEAKFN